MNKKQPLLLRFQQSVRDFIKVIIYLCIFYLCTLNLSASFQSIEKEKNTNPDKTEIIKELRENAKRMVLASNDSCMILYKRALELADKYKNEEEKSLLLRDIGQFYIMTGNFDVAIDTLKKAWMIS